MNFQAFSRGTQRHLQIACSLVTEPRPVSTYEPIAGQRGERVVLVSPSGVGNGRCCGAVRQPSVQHRGIFHDEDTRAKLATRRLGLHHRCVVQQHYVGTDTPTEHVDADQERSRRDAG